ncbi:MAG: hypothetical protein ACRDN0_14535, partial [Trebonia sp.]
MRYRTLLSGAALAMLALTASACASGTSGGTGATGAGAGANAADVTGGGGSAVTATQARQVFDSYVSGTTSALASDNKQGALALTTGVASDTVTDQFAASARTQAKPPSYRYGTPVFYRPALPSYPRWFVASVPRTASAAPAPADSAGVSVSKSGQVLMVFAKESSASSWQLASSAQLAPGQSPPALATSSNGDAESVALDDTTTLAEPQVTG